MCSASWYILYTFLIQFSLFLSALVVVVVVCYWENVYYRCWYACVCMCECLVRYFACDNSAVFVNLYRCHEHLHCCVNVVHTTQAAAAASAVSDIARVFLSFLLAHKQRTNFSLSLAPTAIYPSLSVRLQTYVYILIRANKNLVPTYTLAKARAIALQHERNAVVNVNCVRAFALFVSLAPVCVFAYQTKNLYYR